MENISQLKTTLSVEAIRAIQRGKGTKKTKAPLELKAFDRPSNLPLSYAQQRLWFLEQTGLVSTAYVISFAFQLEGVLHYNTLEAAFSSLLERHESLRTRFGVSNGKPIQIIDPSCQFSLGVDDLSKFDLLLRDERIQQIFTEDVEKGFDLSSGPLFRACLLKLGEEDHILLMNMHHIISDGWSLEVLTRELGALYRAKLHDSDADLAKPELQYADYTLWQRAWLKDDVLNQQLDYWRQQLEGAPRLIDLPTYQPRPSVASFKGDRLCFNLPKQLSDNLARLAQEQEATLFMVLLAAFQVVLGRWSGSNDVVVGSPIAGRTHRQLEDLIGFFVNTQALRGDLSGDPTFADYLSRVKEVALCAYAHQDIPFEKLVAELSPERDLSHQSLFQTVFLLQNTYSEQLDLEGTKATPMSDINKTSQFDITLTMAEKPTGLSGEIEYATDLFNETMMERLSVHYSRVLEQIVADQYVKLSDINILSTEEKEQILYEWNDTKTDYRGNACIHEFFERQAVENPNSIALVFEDTEVTYRALNERSNRLAHYLMEQGVAPDSLVGLSVERSIHLVVGIMGILKSGGAFVPLDPDYPKDRLTMMLGDTKTEIILTQTRVADRLPCATQNIVMVDDGDLFSSYPSTNPRRDVLGLTQDNLAYVIYTSGSTGTPKGVMVEHKSVCNLLQFMIEEFSATENMALCAVTPYSFDVSNMDYFLPLSVGGKMVICPKKTTRDANLLRELLDSRTINFMQGTPATWSLLLNDTNWLPNPSMTIVSAGEVLNNGIYNKFQRIDNPCYNLYGPTETTIYSSYTTFDRGCSVIGRPVANTQLYVFSSDMSVLPIGSIGELYIGGAGLARGYLNRDDLTSERFVKNPINPESGDLLYRTGDLVRSLPDGNLDFVGRVDDQVKIRGFRIELGEIEACLLKGEQISDCVVVARDNGDLYKTLIAYVIPKQDPAISHNDMVLWRDHLISSFKDNLLQFLPDFMVPAVFVFMDEFPLTNSGKIDRKSLPAPQSNDLQRKRQRAAASETEKGICLIWQNVLGIEKVGIHDNFFELGGHSLLAIRVAAQLREVFGVEVSIDFLFDAPTVSEIAAFLDAEPQSEAQVIRVAERPDILPLSYAQRRMWFIHCMEGPSPTYNMPIAFSLKGNINIPALELAFSDLMVRHESLRTIFATDQFGSRQKILDPSDITVSLEYERVSEAGLTSSIDIASNYSFDLSSEPPVKIWLFESEGPEYRLVLNVHHIAADAWSMEPMINDLLSAYKARCENLAPDWLPLPLQYVDFSLWQQEMFKSALAPQIEYWKEQLSELPVELELPTDRDRPAVSQYTGGAIPFIIEPALHQKLINIGQKEQATLFMVLHAAVATFLSKIGAGTDIPIGSPVAGRPDKALEDLVGFFVNMIVIRTDLSGELSFTDLLARVRETTLAALANSDGQFELIVEELNPSRSQARHPLFQVMLALENRVRTEYSLQETQVKRLLLDSSNVAKVDLMFAFDILESDDDEPNNIYLEIEYSGELFDKETVEKLGSKFIGLLETIAQAPSEKLSGIDVFSPAELGGISRSLISDIYDLPVEEDLWAWLTERKGEAPNAAMFDFGHRALTYSDLYKRANDLALCFGIENIELGARIAFLSEDIEDIIAGLLACWASDCICIPIWHTSDVNAELILRDSDVEVLIDFNTDRKTPISHDGKIISYSSMRHTEPSGASCDGVTRGNGDDIVCLIYPHDMEHSLRGVKVSKRGLIASAVSQSLDRQGSDKMKLAPRPSVEQFIFAALWAIRSGGTVEIGNDGREILDQGRGASGQLLNWLEASGTGIIIDKIDGELAKGRPSQLLEAYIVSSQGQAMPQGYWGDLCVGGPALAKGYVGNNKMPSERFVADPGDSSRKLFCTSMRARWLDEEVLQIKLSRNACNGTAEPKSISSDAEKVIMGIWQQILGVEVDDVNAHFFESGGSSLKLLKLRNALVDEGIKITVMDLFKQSTIREQAKMLNGGGAATPGRPSKRKRHQVHKSKLNLQLSKRRRKLAKNSAQQ